VSNINSNYINVSDDDRKRAKTFFDRAAQVAAAGQFDYGITMYLDGLKWDPDAVEAHQSLRDVSLRRKASGGKSIGMFEAMKLGRGKDERANVLNAEKLLAHDPGNTKHMGELMEAAYKAGCYDTVLWIAPIMFRAEIELPKPDFGRLQKIRDHYARLERFSSAVEVCGRLMQMKPEDMDLKNEMKNLSAREAMQKGNYATARSFRDSVRDMGAQRDLIESERDVVNVDYAAEAVKKAEAELAADPNEQGKMMKLVEALQKVGTPESEDTALFKLEEFYERTKAFRFRQRAGEIRMKQLGAEERRLRGEIAATPADTEKQAVYKQFLKRRAEEELSIYQALSEQYPTDLGPKLQIADRMSQLGRYIEAIPLYQAARQDPKLRMTASLKLGRTFLAAEFAEEATDTLKELMELYPAISTGDDTAKEIYYWHGRSLETSKDIPNALKSFSQIVKWDFNYRDVQERIKKLRAAQA
jgi:tetratricopeptide (TPR) repeat protein